MKLASLLVAAALFSPAAARADAPAREVFAIVVTNNHASELGRPDLRYADDDGAKYYEMFETLAPADHLHLLTEFDRDTRGLFPQLAGVAHPPTKAAVADAAADVARRSRAALDAGHTVDVYFVFAGHGDVDKGAGFLELADGPLTAEALEKQVLAGIPSTHTHVILDSCNSFFVINARKPGGRRFATPADLGASFAKKLPHVGVFLSTSAEQEVYEWSELQSGIFSHAVRSGLAGAADANGDGEVSYDELRAFVTIASAKVENPQYRPHVFARGPGGQGSTPLVDLTHADALAVRVGPGETRLTVRDRFALPWIDAHTERGAAITLHVPRGVADGGAIDEIVHDGAAATTARRKLPADGAVVAMAELPAEERPSDARGPDDMLRMLFAEPFGPGAMAHVDIYLPPVEVFGVASEDAERMDLLLTAVADQQKSQRLSMGITFLGAGAVLAGSWAYALHVLPDSAPPPPGMTAGLFGASALALGVGLYELASTSRGEQIRDDYRRRMTMRHGDDLLIVADTERQLAALAESHARQRRILEDVSWGVAGISAGALAAWELSGPHPTTPSAATLPIMLGGLTASGALAALAAHVTRSPEERIYKLWRDDPGMRRLHFDAAPLPGGAALSLSGAF